MSFVYVCKKLLVNKKYLKLAVDIKLWESLSKFLVIKGKRKNAI